MSYRALEKETGVGRQTLSDIINGKTQKSEEATLRPLREWHVQMIRKGYEIDTGGEQTEEAKLIAIVYLFQDYPIEQQKEFAHGLYEELHEGYARTGPVPKWMPKLKKLIDAEWP